MRRRILMVAIMALLAGQARSGAGFVESLGVAADRLYVGSGTCLDCHSEVEDFYAGSPHAAQSSLVIPGTAISGCEACHGPGSAHVQSGGEGEILGRSELAGLDEAGRLRMCTQCHQGHATRWNGGPHDGAGIGCADCHADQVHFGAEARPVSDYRNPSEFCLQCHPAQTAEFRLASRHRVLENQMACSDCHNPHAAATVGVFGGVNESCLGCHQEMSGPFVFEHEGVGGEDCTACHKPHGSHHEKLLVTEGNSLCLQCHYDAEFNSGDGWSVGNTAHAGFALGNEGRCLDCHTEIHGSNVAPTFRNQ